MGTFTDVELPKEQSADQDSDQAHQPKRVHTKDSKVPRRAAPSATIA
jgi:hypothetical protein